VSTLYYCADAVQHPAASVNDPARQLQRALDGFLRSTERRALRMAQIGGAEHDDALDIVQDAMIGFVKYYANKPQADWPALFYSCLMSRVTDWQRRSSVRGRWFKRLLPVAMGEDEPDPLEQLADDPQIEPSLVLAGQEFSGALDVALKRLPLRQRQVFVLRVWEGLDVAQTAQALNIGEGSIKTHLFRALKTLREQLRSFESGFTL
jgi:RNA polymerase sigma-70 factor, ECF subfamily